MLIETEISAYIPQAVGKPRAQIFEEIASIRHETKRIPDPYPFLITPEGLFSPTAKGFVRDQIKTDSPVRELEHEAFLKIEEWSVTEKAGSIFWISPPANNNDYRNTKIVVSEIRKDGPAPYLFNRGILLDLNSRDCLNLAKSLAPFSHFPPENLDTVHDVRKNPIIIYTQEWFSLLSKFVDLEAIKEWIDNDRDVVEKEKSIEFARSLWEKLTLNYQGTVLNYYDMAQDFYHEAQRQSYFGKNSTSCPSGRAMASGAFSLFFESAIMFGATFDCPRCKGPIPSGLGITTCPHCGITKEAAGSTCG